MTKVIKHVFITGLILVCCFNYVTAWNTGTVPPTSSRGLDSLKLTEKKDCLEGGPVAVMFRELSFSKYLVWVAAALLLAGILQILIGLFVFLSDALDIYMLLLNYCIATLFCICTILISGGGTFEPLQNTCKYLSPLSSIAISVPMMTLFLLSYSRFYAITYPFYYVDKFTVINQLIVCFLSWFIPIIVVGLGTAFLCTSISVHTEKVLTGFCVYPSQPVYASSHLWYSQNNDTKEWGWGYFYGGYMDGDIPADSGCQIYMIIYVLICLILPLSGCIVCYSAIVYQLTIIKKNRESSSTGHKITNSSTGGANPADQFVTVNESQSVPMRSMKSKTFSVASLKQHLKKQTSNISQKAKERVPVSVILILTLYIFVAVPLTIVEVYNTSLVGGNTSVAKLVWKNLDEAKLTSLREDEKKNIWCDDKIKDSPTFTQDWVTTFLDIGYSVGLLALGLSPWAYIKFTKSFEENLWLRPLKKISGKIGLEISKSVRNKFASPGHAKPVTKSNPNYSANGTTSGYSSGLCSAAPPTARNAPPSPRPQKRPITPQPPGRTSTAGVPPPQPSPRASPRASPNVGKNPPDPVTVEVNPPRQSLTAPDVDPATGRPRRRCRSRNPSAENPTTDQTDAAPDNNNNI
ncbi:uncharacterized protein LOC134811529 isoform X2 [Bolinopsis microptera]|uniref:uncharacterized protein LOC134811529 isoform X2 n=1 Tax=Bolinopsis microptera TaxID=2820187 RepID=UPI00307967E6